MGTALAIQSFRRVDLSGLAYAPMIKDTSARLYVVPIDPPLRIQTTPVALATSLEDPDVPFVYLSPDASLAAFFKKTEKAIEDACVANKTAWFAAKFEDDLLRRGFKSFFSGDAGFKVKVPADVACFNAQQKPIGREDVPAGSVVRAVLEMSRICFGRHEYGATWKLVQLQVVETTCLIQADDVQPPAEADDDDDSDANEFL